MKTRFKVGDNVRFLNETGGGIITRIDEKGLVHVEAEDGFEIPAKLSDIIPAGGFNTDHLEQETLPDLSGPEPGPRIAREDQVPVLSGEASMPANVKDSDAFDVLLGFAPQNPGPVFSSPVECFLINDSDYMVYYRLGASAQGMLHHLAAGMIEANTKYRIRTYNHTELSKISAMHVQVLWLSTGKYTHKPAIDRMIELTGVNFSKESYYFESVYFDSKAVLYSLLGIGRTGGQAARPAKEKLSDIKNEMTRPDQVTRSIKRSQNDTMEIDLHIESIAGEHDGQTPAEILAFQMKRLDTSMEEAISKKMRRLVIIHGVGQGTLKMQIRKELQEKYPEYQFQDASFREYGFGATLVHLHTIRKQ